MQYIDQDPEHTRQYLNKGEREETKEKEKRKRKKGKKQEKNLGTTKS